MAPSIASSQVYGFGDGGSGHVCAYTAGAPSVGDFDVLCVNSDTTVSTPPGFTASVSAVTNQGAYIFTRKAVGGEGASVTVTTNGNFNCDVIWVRVAGANAVDVTGSAQTNGAAGGVTSPAFTSSPLAESTELALAFAALHTFNTVMPTSPVWSSGYTALASNMQGSGASAAGGFVAYKVPAGTAAESPSVSWTNGTSDRYMLFVSVTAAATGAPVVPGTLSVSTAAPRLGPASASARLGSSTSGGQA